LSVDVQGNVDRAQQLLCGGHGVSATNEHQLVAARFNGDLDGLGATDPRRSRSGSD
jgi:hypothetical protein